MELLRNKKANIDKLKAYGFKKEKGKYVYKTDIIEGEFCLYVYISENGDMDSKLVEKETNEIYCLHLTDAKGGFVGGVREEYNKVLTDIISSCYETQIFGENQTHKVIEFVKKEYGGELEFLWEKFSNNAIVRRADNKKWYVLFIKIPAKKLGIKDDKDVEVIDIRMSEDKIKTLINNKVFFPAYHMNKKHWVTILMDGSLPIDKIKKLIDESYNLAKK